MTSRCVNSDSITLRNGACPSQLAARPTCTQRTSVLPTSQTDPRATPNVATTTNTMVDPRTSAHPYSLGNLARVSDLTRVLEAIAASDERTAVALIHVTPSLVTAGLARRDEFFLAQRLAQVYEGDTNVFHAVDIQLDDWMAVNPNDRGADIRRIPGAAQPG